MKKNVLLLIVSLFVILMMQTSFAISPLMNELFSRGTAVELDWIEIYNASSNPFDISGYKIYDIGGQSGSKPKKVFPAGSIIPANGFLVIIVDDTSESGFGLSSNGERVWFETDAGLIIDSVDLIAITDLEASYGRVPDGSSNFQIISPRTRGTANGTLDFPVVMNELFSRGTNDEPDWIEIYNPSATSFDISGCKIYDSGGFNGTKPKKEFPAGSVIPANGFLVIMVDDTAASGFGLSSSGEKVWFENASGEILDSVDLIAITDTAASYGRLPDGSDNWQTLVPRTRGYSNVPVSAVVLINELFSRGIESELDWIEIYNSSVSPVDISGYKIYDGGGNAGTKPKKEFPAGSVIPANGFLVIIVDDTAASGFGLSSGGEKVWFENATGAIIDSVDLVAITDTAASFGRYPDGSANWQILIPRTRGVANMLTAVEDEIQQISEFRLNQNYPNPFNPTTTISFTIAATSDVALKVFNVLGKEVATVVNEMKSAGNYSIIFNSSGLSSGVYFYQLKADNIVLTKKFVLMK